MTQPGDKLAVSEDNFGVGGASKNPWCRFCVIVHDGQVGPTKDGAIRIRGIGCGELNELGFLWRRFGSKLAKQVDRGG